MITVEYTYGGPICCVQMFGHARSAPKGADLICCAASTLSYTLAQCVLDHYAAGNLAHWPTTVLDGGYAKVEAAAAQETTPLITQTFQTVVTGFRLLEQQYPQYITVKESSPEGLI